MKKFLAILLAMMLVMVSVAAMATEGTGDNQPPAQNSDVNGNDDGGNGGNGGNTTTIPEYEHGTGKDKGQDTIGTPRLSSTLENGGSITLDKMYDLNIIEGAKLPVTDISFSATLISISDSTVKESDMSEKKVTISYTNPTTEAALSGDSYNGGKITIDFPEYPEVGIYTYTVTETGSNYAGITYSKPITMKVTVVRLNGTLQIAGLAFRLASDDTKLDDVTNKYEAGTLTVTKAVDGNLGDREKDFEITVTFTVDDGVTVQGSIDIAETTNAKVTKVDGTAADNPTSIAGGWKTSKSVTFTLRHNDTITFKNLPKGVSYQLVETTYDDYTSQVYNKAKTAIKAGQSTPETVTNTKNVEVDTGITLETLPYVLMMALAMMGLVALKLRKREEY